MNPISARLLNQQLICPQFTAPHQVVEWLGAVQAQDYRMMRWAVGMRTKRPSARAFKKDFNAGKIVRTHLFRTTWQLVAGEDLMWMLDLCRDTALRGLMGWMHTNKVYIPKAEEEKISTILADVLEKQRVALKSDFAAALEDRGIEMTDQRLSYHIRLAEFSGLLCSGDLLPLKQSYALTRAKLPASAPLTREEALARLARKYFRSHGPATLEDFVWWSGLNISDCRLGVDAIREQLTEERWKRQVFYLHEDCRTRGFRSGCVHLLPPYDEYLIGYKSRHVSLHPDHRHRAHNQSGLFWPVVLQDGEVVGNWCGPAGKVDVEYFHPGIERADEALQKELERYARFFK